MCVFIIRYHLKHCIPDQSLSIGHLPKNAGARGKKRRKRKKKGRKRKKKGRKRRRRQCFEEPWYVPLESFYQELGVNTRERDDCAVADVDVCYCVDAESVDLCQGR